jgi:hypothetical protein
MHPRRSALQNGSEGSEVRVAPADERMVTYVCRTPVENGWAELTVKVEVWGRRKGNVC